MIRYYLIIYINADDEEIVHYVTEKVSVVIRNS